MSITVRDFLERFPEFRNVSEVKIAAVIDEAMNSVGLSWRDVDRDPARKYLAAHLLASEGEPGMSNALAAGTVYQGPMKRRKVGDVEVEFQNQNEALGTGNGGLDRDGYLGTTYGRKFLSYMRRNFAPIAIL